MKKRELFLLYLSALGLAALCIAAARFALFPPAPAASPLPVSPPPDTASSTPVPYADIPDHDLALEEDFRVFVSADDLSVTEGLDDRRVNILLMGVDSAAQSPNRGRSDAMIICSVDKVTGNIRLASLARDLWVPIPGAGTNRINTANAFGGPYLAIKCVNENLKLNITRYCSVNFRGFAAIVDALGGVDLEITAGEAGQINQADAGEYVRAGLVHLNGEQALAYCRIRKIDNNFGRNQRQRTFLQALADKVLSGYDTGELLDIAGMLMEYMSTNLSMQDVVSLLIPAASGTPALETYSAPEQGQYRYETIRDASVVTADLNTVADGLHAFLYGE